ncbi:MAG: hypothetical protein ACOYL5_15880 [Phototrophicaceae bacterium]
MAGNSHENLEDLRYEVRWNHTDEDWVASHADDIYVALKANLRERNLRWAIDILSMLVYPLQKVDVQDRWPKLILEILLITHPLNTAANTQFFKSSLWCWIGEFYLARSQREIFDSKQIARDAECAFLSALCWAATDAEFIYPLMGILKIYVLREEEATTLLDWLLYYRGTQADTLLNAQIDLILAEYHVMRGEFKTANARAEGAFGWLHRGMKSANLQNPAALACDTRYEMLRAMFIQAVAQRALHNPVEANLHLRRMEPFLVFSNSSIHAGLTYYELGVAALYEAGDYPLAAAYFAKAEATGTIMQYPRYRAALNYVYALVNTQIGAFQHAQDRLMETLGVWIYLSPQNLFIRAQLALGYNELRAGHTEDARRWRDQVYRQLELVPDSPVKATLWAETESELGRHDEPLE